MSKTTKKHRPVSSPSIKTKKRLFSVTDYESNDGMLTTVWGPSKWHFLHTMSFNYPVHPSLDDKRKYRNYMLSLKYVLPCGKCRKNLKENYKKLPLTMSHMKTRDTFSRYVYDLHELVNDMLGKKSGLTFEQVRERYEHFRARCVKSSGEILKKKTVVYSGRRSIRKTKKKENGCTEPLFGEKSKCVLQIVPQNKKCDTFQMDSKCVLHRDSFTFSETTDI